MLHGGLPEGKNVMREHISGIFAYVKLKICTCFWCVPVWESRIASLTSLVVESRGLQAVIEV
jgi:hypothetical protein